MTTASVAALAFALSLAGCVLLSASPRLRERVAVAPREDRWHARTTPGLGGVPLYLAVAAGVALADGGRADPSLLAALGVGATVLLAIGLLDDLRGLSPRAKLAGQALAATLCVALAQGSTAIPDGGAFAVALGTAWLISIVNGVNLLDNMDGLAGGTVLIAAVTIAIALATGMPVASPMILYVALAGAAAGFLALNAHPARLFMGDAGSLWLGLALGAGALLCALAPEGPLAGTALAWLLPPLLCWLPLLDTTTVAVTRKLRGRPLSEGGRDHLSHRLVALGLSERASVALLWSVAASANLLALAPLFLPRALWIALTIVFVTTTTLLAVRLGRLPPERLARPRADGQERS